ncbi:hypothetical protein [Paenibacillus sp. S150]|uniref:hypothetical protein n=1 Tax=Paenibacillus sp. S150 TaxID=2749826 RepID=UPI001C596055|nr:hypothetical protein [Paenibacillus sp. S150]
MNNGGEVDAIRFRQLAAAVDEIANAVHNQVAHMLLQALRGHCTEKVILDIVFEVLQQFVPNGNHRGFSQIRDCAG